jgi:hypothetical protein
MATTALAIFSRLQHRPPPLTRTLWRAVIEKRYRADLRRRRPPSQRPRTPMRPRRSCWSSKSPPSWGSCCSAFSPSVSTPLFSPLFFLRLCSSPNLLLFSCRDLRRTSHRSSSLPEQLVPSHHSIRFSPSSWRRNSEQAARRSMAPWR